MNVEKEVEQLVTEIRRIGAQQGDKFGVSFGTLFDDERCQDIFEAIMGTLRAAKRQKKIEYPGQLLLKGTHDKVFIELLV
ncbi:hypothetical protein BBJ28_00019392 [Nothophytophthora sp. Chile5]|nr:hypothetical protein BBJ28_00019392 [Nothophytophthora sp. Chile5]